MAVVYRGRDTALDREVAVKLLHPHLAARAESRARFSREARAVARLKHPNIVEIFDYAGDAAVESYLVTEFVHGRTLRAFADEERLAHPELGALLVRALADALAHAHGAGVIHRDLKPDNVLVLESGGARALKLVDFGIARILTSDDRMTMTGALVGSPNHMAPEIIEGREADERSDVFSLGTILYWLSTGRLPFAAPNPTATLRRVIDGRYEDPRRASPGMPEALAAAIDRALIGDPERRTQTAVALRDELDTALASVGLSDPVAELASFLADTTGYAATLRGRLVSFALARADDALAARDTAHGMRLLDRVLALDPGNAGVAARLARLTSQVQWRRRRRVAALVGLPVVVVALGVVGVIRWREARVTVSPPAVVVERAGGGARDVDTRPTTAPQHPVAPEKAPSARGGDAPPSALPAQGAGSRSEDVLAVGRRQEAAAAAVARRTEAPGPPAARPIRTVSVQLHVRPYAQRALLDGVEVAHGEQRVAFTFSTGSAHRIQVEHACCFPFVREFAAGEVVPQPLELKVPLRPRPARLRVDADPATRIYVEGKLVGTAGDSQRAPLEIPVPTGGETPYEAPAQLRLERDGAAPLLTTLRVRAGGELAFAAATVPAPQERGEPTAATSFGAPPDAGAAEDRERAPSGDPVPASEASP